MAQAHTGLTGAATSIGEQPLKGLVNPAAMARIALGEALTNLMFAAATDIADIKASVNWMCAPVLHPFSPTLTVQIALWSLVTRYGACGTRPPLRLLQQFVVPGNRQGSPQQ